MRTLFIYIIALLMSCLTYAADVGIITTSLHGKPAYLVQVGAYTRQKEAEEVQKKLSSSVHQTVKIDHLADKGLYLVQIGPINNYALARKLQQKLIDPEAEGDAEENTTLSSTAVTELQPVKPKIPAKIWNLRNADIRAVIAEVSRITGKNFIVDPKVMGKISIVSTTPISDRELYQVFLSMLQVSGFAAIPSGGAIKIVPNIDARTVSPDSLNALQHTARGDEMMVQVIPIQYVPAEQLVPVLRPLMPQWSSVSAYGPSNMLILSGRANNIRQLAEIIKQVDSSSASGIDVVPLEHALAMDVANTLKDLVKSQLGANQRNQSMLAADDRSNSILISGSKTDRIRIRMLISQLDQNNPNATNSNTQVIYLNYLRAEDLVPILAGIAQASFSGIVGTTIGTVTRPALDSTNPASNMASLVPGSNGTSSINNQTSNPPSGNGANPDNTTGTNTQSEGTTKPSVQIIAEPNTNSIIINAPATLIRTLKTVINQLDIKPEQLLIEALVAEINESDFKNLGVEWGSVQKTGDTSTFRPGFAILNSKTSIDQFQAQIYALARIHKANILSTPSVVVLDNRQAKILIGKQVSIQSTSYPNNAGGTTSASPYSTYDRVNVALHLYVRPQITRGKGIQMQIDQGNDTLDATDTVNPGTTPTFNISAIVTSVHVESGDIIVLGGLAQDSLSNDNDRLPILGDIPGIGRLFQRNSTNREKKVLMVFIRPHILKTESQALEVTGSKYNHVRQDQLDIARSQEEYYKTDRNTIAPAWHTSTLPKPFCHTTKQPTTVMKE
ncbi:MAG: GspD family T2SS secretin variant LspD [Legionellaceae bacterium]|nr:GspD family T2SS secretin variant LspD [Legionellaceae bacterium]